MNRRIFVRAGLTTIAAAVAAPVVRLLPLPAPVPAQPLVRSITVAEFETRVVRYGRSIQVTYEALRRRSLHQVSAEIGRLARQQSPFAR